MPQTLHLLQILGAHYPFDLIDRLCGDGSSERHLSTTSCRWRWLRLCVEDPERHQLSLG